MNLHRNWKMKLLFNENVPREDEEDRGEHISQYIKTTNHVRHQEVMLLLSFLYCFLTDKFLNLWEWAESDGFSGMLMTSWLFTTPPRKLTSRWLLQDGRRYSCPAVEGSISRSRVTSEGSFIFPTWGWCFLSHMFALPTNLDHRKALLPFNSAHSKLVKNEVASSHLLGALRKFCPLYDAIVFSGRLPYCGAVRGVRGAARRVSFYSVAWDYRVYFWLRSLKHKVTSACTNFWHFRNEIMDVSFGEVNFQEKIERKV